MGSNQEVENVYHIDPSESFKSPPVILSGSNNYSKWFREITRAFNLKRKLGFVDGTIEVPPKNHRNYGAWEKCNQLVLSWIVNSVSPEIASTVVGIENAVYVWRNLKKRFSPGNQFIILEILEEIHSLKQGDRDVASYFKEFCLLWSDLELVRPVAVCACATKCSCGAMQRVKEQIEQEKVGRFLKGLDDHRFDGIRNRMMREEPLPPLSQVCISIFQEETHMVNASLQSQPPPVSSHTLANTHPQKEAAGSIQILVHSIHPYPLTLKPARESYTCSGCKELAFGPSYRCESSECTECNEINGIFILDEDCANAVIERSNNMNNNSPVHHPFFKNSNFYFREKPPGYPRYCDACTKDVKGFEYHCSKTSMDLHPRCMKLKSSVSSKEDDVTLKLCETIPAKVGKCQKCRKNNKYDKSGKGWSYVSSNGDYCFHVSCFKELIHENYDFFKQELSKEQGKSSTELGVTTGGGGGGGEARKVVVKDGGRSRKVVVKAGAIKKVRRIASAVIKLLFSAIFGDPVSLVFGLLEVVIVGFG